jgi:CRP-like cAMP-binding protein
LAEHFTKINSLVKKFGGLLKPEYLIEVKMENPSKMIRSSSFWANLFKAPAEKSDLENVLHSMPPFKELNSKYLKLLLKLIHNRLYAPNEHIFYQGDPGIGLYIIRDGEVVVNKTTEDGEQFDLASFHRGDFFGELALLDEETRSASAIAMKETKIAVLFKPDLDEFIETYPKQGIKILRGLSQIIATRLREVNEDYLELYNSTRKK